MSKDAITADSRLALECASWLYARRSPAMQAATFEQFVADSHVEAAIIQMSSQRTRAAVAADRAGTAGWRDEVALSWAEAHEGYTRRAHTGEAGAFAHASALQAGRAEIAASAGDIVDKAVAETLTAAGPVIGTKLQALQRRLDKVEQFAFEIEVRAADDELPTSDGPWEATFIRDYRRLVERIKLRAPGTRGWDARIERDVTGLISKAIFSPAP